MSRKSFDRAFWFALYFAVAFLPRAQAQATQYAYPAGVFAKIDIEVAKTTCTADHNGVYHYQKCFHDIFEGLLANEAVSGITVGERWDDIEPAVGACGLPDLIATCDRGPTDWSLLDEAFKLAGESQKSVALILTPGVDTPLWVFAKMSSSCDNLFIPGISPPPHDCGYVTLTKFQQQQRADSKYLPLPWDPVYRSNWKEFLRRVRNRYAGNPAFVAIAVAGPNAASNEIIYPTSAWGALIGPKPGVDADTAWTMLFRNAFPKKGSDYWNSDQAIVTAWENAIDDYEQIFSGITLVLSPDAGNYLPELPTIPDNTTLNSLDCGSAVLPNSCAAKANIINYFLYNYEGGLNAKATRVGGMVASSPVSAQNSRFGIGLAGVKLLTPTPLPGNLLQATPLLGGAEFDHPISQGKNIEQTGCPDWPTHCDPTTEEAAFGVMSAFFRGTPAAQYWGGLNGVGQGVCGKAPAPMQYLEVPFVDIQNASLPPPTMPGTLIPSLGTTSLQDLFNTASTDLLAMAKNQGSVTVPCK